MARPKVQRTGQGGQLPCPCPLRSELRALRAQVKEARARALRYEGLALKWMREAIWLAEELARTLLAEARANDKAAE